MAKNKKSFVLYADLMDRIDHLTSEEKGVLLQHLLEYVNDLNPVLEDRVLIGVWKPIEQQLKRDLNKFEEVKLKRSEAGKESARLRAVKKQNQTKQTSVKSVKSDSSNPTVNDNVNVNVTVNDILLEKETKELFNVWIDYRKEIRKPIKSDKTLVTLAKRMQKEGLEKSTQVINTTIENGWQGLFWDKQPPKETPGKLIDGYINPTNGKININELTKKINGTTS